jgi:hypothetical protein
MKKFRKGDRVQIRKAGAEFDGRTGTVELQWRDDDGTTLIGIKVYDMSYVPLVTEDQLERTEEVGRQLPLGAA